LGEDGLMRPKRSDYVIRFARLLLGLIFLAAAAAKGVDITSFVRQNESLLWAIGLPISAWVETLAVIIAFFVILFEFLVAAMLISGWWARLGAGLSLSALIVFSLVTVFAWLNNVEASCGCFGSFFPRNAVMAVIENFILLIPAVIAIRPTKALKKHPPVAFWILVTGFVWVGLFYYYPYSGSSLRKGMKPELPVEVVIPRVGRIFVWFFDPECTKCVDQLRLVQTLTGGGTRVAGITDATDGRIEEFILDLKPGFSIVRVSQEDYRKYGVHDGTLIEIKGGLITRLWSGYAMTSYTAALSVGN